jgi:sensor domain CHASE-containing protein
MSIINRINRIKLHNIMSWSRIKGSSGSILKTICLALVFLIFFQMFDNFYQKKLLQEARSDVRLHLAEIVKRFEIGINQRMTYLLAMESYAETESAQPGFKNRFEKFAANLYQDMDGIRNFVIAPRGINRYVYPLKGNENVLGHNLLLDTRPEVQGDVSRCLSAKTVIVSAPYHLRQSGMGIALRKAISMKGVFGD